ncbi:MAG: DUF2164 domain-containing protein [Granulosicoccus sp.]
MAEIVFTSEQKDTITERLKTYFEEELDRDLGQFEAQFLLDFLIAELGPHFYNQGLYDARAIMEKRVDDITESIYSLEKITDNPR